MNLIFLYDVASLHLIFNQHCRQCWEFPPVHQPKAHKFCKGWVTIWSDDPAGTFPTSMNNTFFTNPESVYMAWSMMICFHKFTPSTTSIKFISYISFQCICCILDDQEFWKYVLNKCLYQWLLRDAPLIHNIFINKFFINKDVNHLFCVVEKCANKAIQWMTIGGMIPSESN